MRPNVNRKDELMIQCDCCDGKAHESFVVLDHSEASPDNHEIWLSFLSEPSSLFDTIRQWFQHRRRWHSEAMLNLDDVKSIRDECDRIIEKLEGKGARDKKASK